MKHFKFPTAIQVVLLGICMTLFGFGIEVGQGTLGYFLMFCSIMIGVYALGVRYECS